MSQDTKKGTLSTAKGEIQGFIQKIDELMKKFKTEISGKQLDSEINEIQDNLTKNIEQLRQQLKKQIENLDSQTDKLFKDSTEDLVSRINNSLGEVKNVLASAEKETSQAIASQQKFIDGQHKTIRNQIGQETTAVFKEEQEALDGLQDQIRNISSYVSGLHRQFVESTASALKTEMGETISEIEKALTEFREHNTRLVHDSTSGIETTFNTAITTAESNLEQSASTAKDMAEDIVSIVEKSFQERMETLQNTIADMEAKFGEIEAAKNEELDTTYNETQAAIKQFKSVEMEEIDRLAENTSETFFKMLDLKGEESKKVLSQTKSTFRAKLYNELESLGSSFTTFYDAFIAQIDEAITRLQSASQELRNSLDEMIVKRLGKVQLIAEGFEDEMERTVNSIHTDYDGQFTEIKSNFQSQVEKLTKDFTNRLDTLEIGISDKIAGLRQATQKQDSSYQTAIKELAQQNKLTLDEGLSATHSSINGKMNKFSQDQRKWVDETKHEIVTQLKREGSTLKNVFESIPPQISGIFDEFDNRLKKQQAVLQSIDSKISDILSDIDSQEQKIAAEGVQQTAEVQGKVTHIEENISKNLSIAVKKVLDKQQEEINGLKENIGVRLSSYNATLKETGPEGTKRIREVMADQLEMTRRMISQLSDEIDTLNGKINEFRGNVAQMKTANAKKIDFFVRNVSNEITNIKTTSSDIAKTTDKIIREM